MSNPLDFQVTGYAPSTVGGLGATVKYFPRLIGPSIGVAPSTPSATNPAGALWLPAAGVFNGQVISVISAGNSGSDTGDPSGTVTVALYGVSGTASVPIYSQLGTTGAMTPGYAVQPWALYLELVGSSLPSLASPANGIQIGSYQALVSGSITAPTTISTVITGLDYFAGNPSLQRGAVLGYVVGVTFGTTNSTNTAQLTEFTIES